MKSLKHFLGRAAPALTMLTLALAIAAAALLAVNPASIRDSFAAVTNYPPGVAVYTMPIHLNGPYAAATQTPLRFKLPYAARLIGFSASAVSISGTITVDLKAAGSSLLSAPITLSTAVGEATITTSAVADEAEITAVVATSGVDHTVSDITILPTFLRR